MNTTDKLMERYYILADTRNIESMEKYALSWKMLADDFAVSGRVAMSAMCKARAEFYGEQAGGEYVRLIDGSLSELLEA